VVLGIPTCLLDFEFIPKLAANVMTLVSFPKVYTFSEKQSANYHNMLTAEGQLTDHYLAPEKGGKAKKEVPSKPIQQKPNSKAGWLVGYRADLQNVRTTFKLKLPHLTEGGAN
jgi:hypothetical protein